MPSYSISYDLVAPGKNYDELIKTIKAYGIWCHALKSTWFIVTNESAEQIRNNLTRHMDANDKIIVNRVKYEAAWRNLPADVTSWLKNNLRD